MGWTGRRGRNGKTPSHPACPAPPAHPSSRSHQKSNCTPNLKNLACRMLSGCLHEFGGAGEYAAFSVSTGFAFSTLKKSKLINVFVFEILKTFDTRKSSWFSRSP